MLQAGQSGLNFANKRSVFESVFEILFLLCFFVYTVYGKDFLSPHQSKLGLVGFQLCYSCSQ